MKRMLAPVLLLFACAARPAAARDLEIFLIDVEGGQSTLIVAPSGESMLVDTGWPGFDRRDATRILAACKAAGVKRIDYLVITHYHADHAGGVPQLAEKMPILNFVDYGDSQETGRDAKVLMNAYAAFRAKGNHIQVKPGDRIPVKGLEVTVVAAAGEVLPAALPEAGRPNPDCAGYARPEPGSGENPRSVGLLIGYGAFRMIDLADLTADREYPLACPDNRIGTASLFLASHHGNNDANSPPFVHAIRPRIAIINNGARKGGGDRAWQTLRDAPGLEDIWQLHFAVAGGREHNAADAFIANVDEICEGKWLRVTVLKDGSFTVFNPRNRYTRTYAPR